MQNDTISVDQTQYLNIAGQNNYMAGVTLSNQSLQTITELTNFCPGVDADNGIQAAINSISGKIRMDTNANEPMTGEVYLVAADSLTQQTNGVGPTSSLGDLFDSIFGARVAYRKIGALKPEFAFASNRNWYSGNFFYRPSKKARQEGWNLRQTTYGKSVYIVLVLYFNQPGLGVSRDVNITTRWHINYTLSRNVFHI